MKHLFFLFGLCLFLFSSCNISEAHNRGYVISKSEIEESASDSVNQ